jgi:membrane associated rhomboid family serine protease
VLPIFFLPFLLAWSASTGESVLGLVRRNITLIPAPQTENLSAREEIPRGTSTLILLNIIAFIASRILLGSSLYGRLGDLVYPPVGSSSLVHPTSLLFSMFLHADLSHLAVFLLGVGTVLEKRVGGLKFLSLYFLTGALGSVLSAKIYLAVWGTVHMLGASGAISGIMGVVAVRCYANRMVWPIPIFGLLPISIKIRMSSLVLMGMFFFRDLGAGLAQLDPTSSNNVAHWAHLAGMVAGMVVALLLRMGQEALEEKRITTGILSLEDGIGLAEGEESLRAAVAANPENLEAKLALARMTSRRWKDRSGEAARLYQDVMARAINTEPELAATAFLEYLRKYRRLLDPALHLRLSLLLYRLGDPPAAPREGPLPLRADSRRAGPQRHGPLLFPLFRRALPPLTAATQSLHPPRHPPGAEERCLIPVSVDEAAGVRRWFEAAGLRAGRRGVGTMATRLSSPSCGRTGGICASPWAEPGRTRPSTSRDPARRASASRRGSRPPRSRAHPACT